MAPLITLHTADDAHTWGAQLAPTLAAYKMPGIFLPAGLGTDPGSRTHRTQAHAAPRATALSTLFTLQRVRGLSTEHAEA